MTHNMDQDERPPAGLLEVAADWHTRMEDPQAGPEDRARLDVWLNENPAHAAAYQSVTRMCTTSRRFAAAPRILEFRHEALAATRAARGRAVPPSGPAPRPAAAWNGSRVRLAAAAAVLLAFGVAVFSPSVLRQLRVGDATLQAGQKLDAGIFTTAVGERSTITLSDGSSIALDTNSRVDVDYLPATRRIHLVQGQAWFQVAKNPARPFVVDAGDRRITALGTAFDVRLGGSEPTVQVTLAEGKVSVEALQSPLARLMGAKPQAAVLMPGESLTVANAKPVLTRRVDMARVSSWRDGRIMFDADTLGSALVELNRYSTTRIEVSDPALAALRISGVFRAGQVQGFIETLTGHYPIVATGQPDGRVVLSPRPPAVTP